MIHGGGPDGLGFYGPQLGPTQAFGETSSPLPTDLGAITSGRKAFLESYDK